MTGRMNAHSAPQRTYLILFWVGFLALFRGFSQIFLAFTVRHTGQGPPPPSGTRLHADPGATLTLDRRPRLRCRVRRGGRMALPGASRSRRRQARLARSRERPPDVVGFWPARGPRSACSTPPLSDRADPEQPRGALWRARQPLAQRRRLAIEHTEVLGGDGDPEALLALIGRPVGGQAGAVQPRGASGRCWSAWWTGTRHRGPLTWPKGSAWMLEVNGGQVQHSRYLPRLQLPENIRPATTRGGSAATSRPLRCQACAAAGLCGGED